MFRIREIVFRIRRKVFCFRRVLFDFLMCLEADLNGFDFGSEFEWI